VAVAERREICMAVERNDITPAKRATSVTTTDRLVLFWDGWPSQWHASPFTLDEDHYTCAEQFMMAEKARVFGDDEALEQIFATPYPSEQKRIGRRVRGFDQTTWNRVCRGIVYRGNLAKFTQNERLRERLLGTGDRIIVEASPHDRVWGIGLHQSEPEAHQPELWQGLNWLGVALMQVRATLAAEDSGGSAEHESVLEKQLAAREALRRGIGS
jgi:hypothetical protein